jgi:anionic cell wall polymer biosynthesis LytR-Cps2A-Psr (LCP) family protein
MPNSRRLILVSAWTIAAVLTVSAAMPAAAAGRASAQYAASASSLLAALTPAGSGLATALSSSSTIRYGSDGRLTLLLAGSDYRPTLAGERTDILIVMTINPKTKQMAAVSIPRDISRLQRPSSLGGGTTGRVNAIFSSYLNSAALKAQFTNVSQRRVAALDRLRQIIAFNLQVEIDYSALIRMTAFEKLIDNISGVTVNIPAAIKDPKYWDNPKGPQGIYFPAQNGWSLRGAPSATTPLCNGYYKTLQWTKPGARCERALVYVRSRKGAGNSDFKRTRRAQDVVAASIRKVVQRGSGSALTSLVNVAAAERNGGAITTNMPMTAADAAALYTLLNGSSLTRQAVLRPTTYAVRITGTTAYRLKLAEVRALTRSWFAPVS